MPKGSVARPSSSAWILTAPARPYGVAAIIAARPIPSTTCTLDLECGINRVAVRSTLQPGEITVTAKCAALVVRQRENPIQTGCGFGFKRP